MNYMEKIVPIVTLVGHEIMQHYRTDFNIIAKDSWSFYTDVDILSQKRLEKELRELIPGSGCIAEELNVYAKHEFTWVIDPIDGTRNFVRGMPYFGISVALMHYSEVIAAVVYMPAMDDLISAQKGLGTWLNGKKLLIDQQRYLSAGALIVASAARLARVEQLNTIKKTLGPVAMGIRFRACGAAAVDLAYTAIGVYDVVLFENLKWWDAAAGKLLILEAGGYVSDYDKQEITESFKTVIAGNPMICEKILNANIL
ncbi:inositol monophosphatase [Candidatus Dependentiae bacterium]|nr:inositol monophosphatase [Candidatus Dependentiae bacterium]